MVIWDGDNYLKEADRELSDNKIYRGVEYTKNEFAKLRALRALAPMHLIHN